MQHEHHRVPVTALAFFREDVILAGEGNYLRAYSGDSRPLKQEKIFESQAIHGIDLHSGPQSTGTVYGGSLLRIFSIEFDCHEKLHVNIGPVQDLGDWILDCAFVPVIDHARGLRASLVTAHNALHIASLDESDRESATSFKSNIECLVSRSNCILYSAHASWLSPSHCLIASGTAFGDVIVWSTFLSRQDGRFTSQTQTHYTFSAHEGSIFGIQISPMLTLPNLEKGKRVLASCSDDRNIKLWDISDLTTESPTLAEMQRQTGFGTSEKTLDVAPPCLAKAMGHVSRIWKVQFVIEGESELRKLQTFGEDASVITWKVNPADGKDLPFTFEKLDTSIAHAGKNIWSAASATTGTLAMGGADGAIALHPGFQANNQLVQIPDMSINGSKCTDNLRAYCFMDTGVLISTTDQGRIVRIDLSQETEKMAVIADPIDSFRGFSLITTSPGIAFVAGADGTVMAHIQDTDSIFQVAHGNGKPAGLFAYKDCDQRTAMLVSTVGNSSARLLLMEIDHGNPGTKNVEEVSVDLPRSFIVTSFTVVRYGSKMHAILGSRSGSIALYDSASKADSDTRQPARVYNFVHGKEAITHLHTLAQDCTNGTQWLFSTGRDGTLAIHRMSYQDQQLHLHMVHQLSLPFGPNIEGMSLSAGVKLLAWGFRSKHFVVYDLTAQREVMSVECGGAHRNWAFQPSNTGCTFIWTKASKVYHRPQSELPFELMNSGGHGREIKSVAISSSAPQIIATGAEDTDIKLHKLESGTFKCLQTLRRHNTGIQCLQWSRDGQYLFSSGGFEEFFVWRVSHGMPRLDVGVFCESRHPRSGTSDLRVMGFDVKVEEHHHFTIAMAYSDSTAKIWTYKADAWELLAAGDYLTACLTDSIWIHNRTCDLISTSTDGYLAKWIIDQDSKQLSWSGRHKVHQSAIHVVTTRKLTDGSTLVASGGDDNAIALTRISSSEGDRFTAKTMLLPRAHAAAVTGLALIPVGKSMYWMISASIDQRVKLWKVQIDVSQPGVDGVEVRVLHNVFTAVADVASLDLCTLEDGASGVIVSGVGMDVWRLPLMLAGSEVK